MFSLVRPCSNCPFRLGIGQGFGLSAARIAEIAAAPAFQCHKTVDYAGEEPAPGSRPQQCAGLMAVLHREGSPNQIMQVAERLGALRPELIDPRGEAYASLADAIRDHTEREGSRHERP